MDDSDAHQPALDAWLSMSMIAVRTQDFGLADGPLRLMLCEMDSSFVGYFPHSQGAELRDVKACPVVESSGVRERSPPGAHPSPKGFALLAGCFSTG